MGCGGSKRAAVADSSSVEAHSAHRRAPPAPAPTGKETGRSHGAQKKGAKGSAHDPQQVTWPSLVSVACDIRDVPLLHLYHSCEISP